MNRPVTRKNRRIAGALIFSGCAAFTGWSWYTFMTKGYCYEKAAVIFPAFAVIGLALVIFPGYREERAARGEDISCMTGLSLITTRWWVILAAAFASGLLNLWLLLK